MPELDAKIESGALSLSVLAKAHGFFKSHRTPLEEKLKILARLEGLSCRKAAKVFAELDPRPKKKPRLRRLSGDLSELTFTVDDAFLNDLAELQAYHSHKNFDKAEALKFALGVALTAERTSRKPKTHAHEVVKPTAVEEQLSLETRYIPIEVRREVESRDVGCTYIDPESGRRCGTTWHLEFDHIQPWALGGKNTADNLRMRCGAHNRMTAEQTFGRTRLRKSNQRLH